MGVVKGAIETLSQHDGQDAPREAPAGVFGLTGGCGGDHTGRFFGVRRASAAFKAALTRRTPMNEPLLSIVLSFYPS